MSRGTPLLSYRTRRRLSLLFLLVGLPLYIVAAASLVGMFERPGIWTELAIYVALGVLWSFPARIIFLGVGKPDPDAAKEPDGGAR